ncbi:foldase protein PrsA [Acidaminobacter hydrogenoformans]|uniref:peptidylprolyl isomerase n=1 Tax=Acidaminobacter hydrogenoformans DSM 2784 TaxID=1120920 RepID=A0A1G5RXB2_9FIRM|nr:peptidylprolyl isomerase [Acidaminobacter hydrogenoformans]SCZ78752.1 foldase protein PrsA [Acidaminobacter hydrogenoformans DSM 2784]
MKNNFRVIITVVVIIALLAGSVYIGVGAFRTTGSGDTVATVGSEKITKDDLYDYMVKQSGQQALDALISEKIIELEAEKNNVKVEASEIDEEIATYEEMYGGKESLEAALASSGFDMDYLRGNIETNLMIKKILEPTIEITETEISDYFTQNKASFDQQEQVSARHILVETVETANEILGKLNAGEEFEALASAYSIDTSNKDIGGSLGFFGRGQMVPAFEEAAFTAEVGKVVGPVETDYGYHLLIVDEKVEAVEATLEEKKEEVRDTLLDQKIQSQVTTWLDEKYQEYNINISM